MRDLPAPAGLLTSMPVLSRGSHRNPSQGACFMEYTSLLAGEAFTDEPRCVDAELATVLRRANDNLSDADRSVLVPLLGRAIGLGVELPPARRGRLRSAAERRERRARTVRYRTRTAQLRRAVSARFLAALGTSASPATRVWCGWGEEVSWLFWDLMSEPSEPTSSTAYRRRLVARLALLHDCYEQAMHDLGLPPAVVTGHPPVDRPAAIGEPDVDDLLPPGASVVPHG